MTDQSRVIHIAGTGSCPNDDTYHHEFYFGCVPRDFNPSTGRTKKGGDRQTQSDRTFWGSKRYLWPGGCHGAGILRDARNGRYLQMNEVPE